MCHCARSECRPPGRPQTTSLAPRTSQPYDRGSRYALYFTTSPYIIQRGDSRYIEHKESIHVIFTTGRAKACLIQAASLDSLSSSPHSVIATETRASRDMLDSTILPRFLCPLCGVRYFRYRCGCRYRRLLVLLFPFYPSCPSHPLVPGAVAALASETCQINVKRGQMYRVRRRVSLTKIRLRRSLSIVFLPSSSFSKAVRRFL